MLIEIDKAVFNSDLNFVSVNKLIQDLTYKRRYDLFIDINSLNQNEVYNRIDVDVRKIIEEFFEKQMMADADIDHKISTQSTHLIFEIDEAIRYFNQQVLIILENSLNDGYFIDALLNNFIKASKKIRNHKEEGWLNYGNAGGATNIINYIQSFLIQFNNLPKENHEYLRVIVILDSDKEYPTMSLKQDKQVILDFMNRLDIKYHILEKREIENYIPDKVIEEIAFDDNDDFLKAYLNLTPIQKDFFDIENGFKNQNYNNLTQEVKDLYSNNSDYNILRKGFNNTNFKGRGKNFKAEFPKLFQNKLTTQDTLLNRTDHQRNNTELKQILSKINELL